MTWMDLEGIMLNKREEKDRYLIISLICGLRKEQTDELNKAQTSQQLHYKTS